MKYTSNLSITRSFQKQARMWPETSSDIYSTDIWGNATEFFLSFYEVLLQINQFGRCVAYARFGRLELVGWAW